MNEPFILPVVYQGTEHEFKARFERWGYTHRIAVLIDETTVTFEPDEEGGYRVINSSTDKKIPVNLLQEVSQRLQSLIG
ncbi:hypothetical protein SNE25_20445 [Mucilaginibacter sabulilitoris]|uniref:Anticodon-binding domain-containing protein n=1 Tax=Mucilaginibacter sabulilitoris TaxID=1173583 RepID=A0ABZ0TFE0_9SPHI|nr:hypothetical protein [Mucilaginibacter sabulilitoris]WPU91692.1 hypothetical protein SNE25_20445 [Mucilaginibacter sabulilitoris]